MATEKRSPIELSQIEFKNAGYKLVDQLAGFFQELPEKRVTTGEASTQLKKLIGTAGLPESGKDAGVLLNDAAELLISHSLFNGHPKFTGYITSSPAPLGTLADMLAAAINPNVGAQILSPVATEIERQTIRWLAEFIGVSTESGGILVSGGNMANFTGFLAGLNTKAPSTYKQEGVPQNKKLLIYCSKTTHTWIEKAAIHFGLGLKSMRWIETNPDNTINISVLEETIALDLKNDHQPIMIIGTAGDVSTGVVDDLEKLAGVSRKYNLWFHIDGAYGIPAAVLPELKTMFRGIEEADSIALDPHKWLYSPLEAGCTLVKNPKNLQDTFSTHPVYYNFGAGEENPVHNFYEYGLQNSRGFRALKVWLVLQQVGRSGYEKMIRKNIILSKQMHKEAIDHPELEAMSQHLSIATFRYVPQDLAENSEQHNDYLNKLNETLLNNLQHDGELFLSNAVVNASYCLRACIVNFRTSENDISEMMKIIVREGRKLHSTLREKVLVV